MYLSPLFHLLLLLSFKEAFLGKNQAWTVLAAWDVSGHSEISGRAL